MKKYAMVIDSSLCIDCKACMVSCKVQNSVPTGHWRNWIKHTVPDFTQGPLTRTHFQPGGCMQCDNPTCVQACPSGATYKDALTGVVRVNEGLCIGCGNCITACPYGARFRHPEKRVPDKCDFCLNSGRLERGLLPACVDTCPTKARVFGDLNDPDSEASRLLKSRPAMRVDAKGVDTKPNMYYLASTAPLDWAGQVQVPPAFRSMAAVVNPVVKIAAGATALGVAVMWVRQLLSPGDGEGESSARKKE